MSIGEIAYLALVVSAFVIFMAGVGFVSWYSGKKPAANQSAQIHALPNGMKKAA